MKRAAELPLALLFGSFIFTSVANAQTPNQQVQKAPGLTSTQTMVVLGSQPSLSCPVSLRARQGMDSTRREVTSEVPKGVGQMLHLIAVGENLREVDSATITVRGLTDKNRLVQALSNQNSSDAAKTMLVRFAPGTGKEQLADVRVAGLSAVTSVEVNSVTYADGSTWKLDAGDVCRSPVDPLMLVGMR